MDTRIEQFKSLIEPWIGAYDRISISAMGTRENSKSILLSARIVLAPTVSAPFQVAPLKDPALWATTQTISFSQKNLQKIFLAMETGALHVGKIDASLELDHTNKPNLGYQTGPHMAHGGNQSAPRFATLTATALTRLSIREQGILSLQSRRSCEYLVHRRDHRERRERRAAVVCDGVC